MMRKIILACLVTFLSAEPKWYNRLKFEKSYLYGNGSARSKELSKQKALADLAASISVSVNSQIYSQKARTNGKIQSKDSQVIHLKTDDLQLDNVEIVKQGTQKGVYYTTLRINKNLFLQSLRDKYNALYAQFPSLMPKTCKGFFLQQVKDFNDLLAQVVPIERILKAYSIPINSVQYYENIYYQNAPKPKVEIVFDDNDDAEVKDALMSAYARVLTPSHAKDLYQVKNKIFTEKDNDNTRIRVNISVSDCQGTPILNRSIEVNEKDKNFALTRLQAMLYKQLGDYANKDGQGNTGI